MMLMLKAGLVILLASLGVDFVDAQRAVNPGGRPCAATPGRIAHAFVGELKGGELFEEAAGRFILRLQPDDFVLRKHPDDNPKLGPPQGWYIEVREQGRDEDLSQFTIPYSGPNARYLFPWFDAAGQPLNAPGERRDFYFSPEVGRTIVWENDSTRRQANIDRVYAYGHGTLDVLDYRLAAPTPDGSVGFEWIKFSACLSWPR